LSPIAHGKGSTPRKSRAYGSPKGSKSSTPAVGRALHPEMRRALFFKLIDEHKQKQADVVDKYQEKFQTAENDE